VLFGASIKRNIAYGYEGPRLTDEELSAKVIEAAKAANADSFISQFKDTYETEVGERGSQLSGGQKQRIAIARAMIRNPKILLLDEATSALDTESERIVQEALDKLLAQRRRTTLVIAHRLSTVRDADQIFVMENGNLLEKGTHQDLMASAGLYSQLVELQKAVGVEPPSLPRQLSRQSSSGKAAPGLHRQRSNTSESGAFHGSFAIPFPDEVAGDLRNVSGEAEEEMSAESEAAPLEDEVQRPIPFRRLLSMQQGDLAILCLALTCTVCVGAASPLVGRLFSDVIGALSKPPARPEGLPPVWVKDYDKDDLMKTSTFTAVKFVCLGTMVFLSSATQNWGFRKAAEHLTLQLRSRSLRAMLRQEMGWFDKRSSGILADRLASEAPLIKSCTGEALAAVIQVAVTASTGLVIAFSASWSLTLSFMAFIPILTVGNVMMRTYINKVNKTNSGPVVSEAVGNMRTIAAFGLEDRMTERYVEVLSDEGRTERKNSVATGLASAYTSGLTLALYGAILFIANIFINHNMMKAADTFQVLFPIVFMAQGLSTASTWLGDQAKAKKAVTHIFNTIDRTPTIDAYSESGTTLDVVKGKIEFRHVKFNYPSRSEIPIFTDFDLKIEPMSTVAFVGPSGSGKSTTVSLLQRFYDPDGGSVCLDDHDIRELNLQWLRAQMALVQQEPVLFAGSIFDNIAYGKAGALAASKEEVEAASRAANAHQFIAAFPDGYDTDAGERGLQLSGGQKQRIAIARAMIRKPKILLLDEATSALDTESERVVQEALDKLLASSQMTTLVIAHRLSTIQNAKQICVIYLGKIVEKGTHAELMARNGQYAKLIKRQLAEPPK